MIGFLIGVIVNGIDVARHLTQLGDEVVVVAGVVGSRIYDAALRG